MFSALKKLTKSGDERCTAPVPMSSSLQKKFSRGVHFNMKILIKGDRNVGKSCLLQRLQGGPFIEEYAPTDQIQVAPIHWTYKNTDHIVKVEVWEVVDKGRTKKKPPLGLKLDNQSLSSTSLDAQETPILDASFLDVYKNANGVILMFDITKPWTFEYVMKEMENIPAELPVVVLGNHCDMQHHRQVHSHHIEQAIQHAKLTRTAPVRYAESSMRNGFGLRLLHKFLSVPFLRLQRTSLLEQLQRNQKDTEEVEHELNEYQKSEESNYSIFLDRLANKRRQDAEQETRPSSDRSPSIVLGAGKPIIPPNVNPLLAHSLNPLGLKAQYGPSENPQLMQTQYVSPDLLKPKKQFSLEIMASRNNQEIGCSQSSGISSSHGALDDFYAGALDNSFLEDFSSTQNTSEISIQKYDSDSDEEIANPMVRNDQDDLDIDYVITAIEAKSNQNKSIDENTEKILKGIDVPKNFMKFVKVTNENRDIKDNSENDIDNFVMWAGDASARRSPEGDEDPDNALESLKVEKKHKKSKKSKDKEKADSEKSEKKEKKHKHRKPKDEKKTSNSQQDIKAMNTYVDNYDSV